MMGIRSLMLYAALTGTAPCNDDYHYCGDDTPEPYVDGIRQRGQDEDRRQSSPVAGLPDPDDNDRDPDGDADRGEPEDCRP